MKLPIMWALGQCPICWHPYPQKYVAITSRVLPTENVASTSVVGIGATLEYGGIPTRRKRSKYQLCGLFEAMFDLLASLRTDVVNTSCVGVVMEYVGIV